jgi:hypothetical protein
VRYECITRTTNVVGNSLGVLILILIDALPLINLSIYEINATGRNTGDWLARLVSGVNVFS